MQVSATNGYGTSVLSDKNIVGARVQTVPHKPATASLSRGSLTTQAQLQVLIQPIEGESTGGSPILSYVIQWDQGDPLNAFEPLVGFTSPSLEL